MKPFFASSAVRLVFCLGLALGALLPLRAVTTTGNVIVLDGEDWSLPSWVQPKPYSGYYAMSGATSTPTSTPHSLIKYYGTTMTWADLNPEPGVYRFDHIQRWLDLARARNAKVLFRLKASLVESTTEEGMVSKQSRMIPEWVTTTHNPPTFYTINDVNAGNIKKYAAPWNAGVQAEFHRFLQAFADAHLIEQDEFLAVYLHGISKSTGEEMNIDSATFTQQAIAAGMTPEVFVKCWKDRMGWWHDVTGDTYSHKVIWVGSGNIAGFSYDQVDLDNHALGLGFGTRRGFIENYFYNRIPPPLAGQRYENGYVISDWNALLRDGRYFGDENEAREYNPNGNPGANPPVPPIPQDVLDVYTRAPYFRAAQIGMNFLWVSNNTITWATHEPATGAGVPKWFTLVAGKGPQQSPDAACWLQETQVKAASSGSPQTIAPWKNLERMLMQRDIEGANTVADEKVDFRYTDAQGNAGTVDVQGIDDNNRHVFRARRTNVGAGQRNIAFTLERDFRESLVYPVQIKITYRDKTNALWSVRQAVAGNTTVELGTVQGEGAGLVDPLWRTATFTVSQPFVPGALDVAGAPYGDIDFVVQVAEGQTEDVSVQFARVVRVGNGTATAPLAVTTPPVSRTAEAGGSVNFSVAVAGTGPFTYQWKCNGTDLANGSGIAGATAANLTLSNVTPGQAGFYTVVIRNMTEMVESDPATLQVFQKFGPWAASQALAAGQDGMLDSPAGDGVSNLLAFGLGLPPKSSKARLLPRPQLLNAIGEEPGEGESSYLTLDIPRAPSASQVQWKVEVSSDLTNWQSGPGATTTIEDSAGRLRVRDNTPASPPATRFIRMNLAYSTNLDVIDGFEDGPHGQPVPAWIAQLNANIPASGVSVTYNNTVARPPELPASNFCAQFSFNQVSTFQYATLKPGIATFGSPWEAHRISAIRFWLKGIVPNGAASTLAADRLKLQLREEADTGERWSYNITSLAKDGQWHLVTIPLSAFIVETASFTGGPTATAGKLDLNLIDQIRFFYNSANVPVTLYIDQIEAIEQ